ncbi:MAG: ComF family protein [bacterium]|nr:ComF family protein [bacterium]
MLYASPPPNVTPSPTRRLLRQLGQWLLPSPCLGCKDPVWETRNSLGLCPSCRRRLVPWPRHSCATCGRLFAAELPPAWRCSSCRRRPPSYERILSAWSYQPPLDAVLMGLKFRRLDYLGAHLGRALAEIYRRELDDCELVVPVPLYWTRRLSRGYNQALTIARPLAAALGIPLAQPLRRRRPTPPQSRLSRAARRRNLKDAFALKSAAACRGRRVLLVDDVTTTGATLEAAAACLRRAAPDSVVAVTAARTPEPAQMAELAAQAGLPRQNG